MSKSVVTNVTLVSANEVDEDEAQQVMDAYDADSLVEVADEMAETVESLLAHRVFSDADRIPILDVSTDVYEDWNEDMAEVRA